MKTRIWQTLILTAATPLALLLAPARAQSADDLKPGANTPVVVATPANDSPAPAPQNAPAPSTPAATNATPGAVIQLSKPSLPPLLDQVVRLSQSGADEKVVRAYIDKAAPAYRITGNEIIELRNLGVSQDVILALIDHSKSSGAENAGPIMAQAGTAPPPPAASPTNAVAAVPATDAAADFYDAMSPYGTWMNLPEYGWCWQPTVVVVNAGWQPYCNYGGWLWSDCGWYWNSYYSWGWAPFHYGRWCSYPNTGWVWCPGQTWGPAWVCWQNSPGYCGWAPLPPHCNYAAGVGWTWQGKQVNANCGFGVNNASYTVVAHDNFAARNVGAYALRGREASAALNNATMVNNFSVGANNRLVNQGIGRDTIAAASRTPIRDVAVRELPRGGNQSTMPSAMPDRVNRVGNASVVYRPGSQISVPRTSVVQNSPSGATVSRPTASPVTTANQRTAGSQSSAPRASVATGNTARRVTPNYTRSYANSGQGQRVYRSGSATSAPGVQSRAFARPAAPVSSAPRAVGPTASAQRSAAPATVGRTMTSGGGGQFSGGVSRGSSMSAPSFGARR